MEWLWLLAATGWLLAAAAFAAARGAARRTQVLTEQYWELKYELGELKGRVKALAPTPDEIEAAKPAVQQTFVPLTSIRRAP